MKARLCWLLLLGLILIWGCAAPQSPSLRDLSFGPLDFHVPEIERLTLANGLRLYLQEDAELPLVEISVMVGAGSIGDPPALTGRTDLYATLLRGGGAGERSPDVLDEALEMMAADLRVSADSYAVTLDLSLRAEDLEAGLAILADVLRRPRFDAQRLEIARRQALEGIRRRNDDPGQVAQRALARILYGEHPLGRSATAQTVTAVTREDLLAFHRDHVHPNNLWIGITGDFDRARLEELLDRHFGDWPAGTFQPQAIAPLDPPAEPAIWVVPRAIPQTTILFGEIGIDKDNPDQYAVRVMNFLLGGGGFNSRLMREVRSNRGLAYSVYSFYQVGRRLPGLFIAGSESRTEVTPEVVSLMRRIMEEMREAPVGEDELALARESLINSFVFGFTDRHDVVTMTMRLDFYDYPPDYLRAYRERVAEVDVAAVHQAARRYLDPARQVLVLVGDTEALRDELAALGAVVKEFSLED